jgi:hypothetical protein
MTNMAIVGNRNSKMANVYALKPGVKKYSNTRLNVLNRDIVGTALKGACGYLFIMVPRLNADFFLEQNGGMEVSFILILEARV